MKGFTIRVYGIFIQEGNLLLSHEKYGEKEMYKFPGGGLEFGEGTIDCLKREMLEEYGLQAEILSHFYTTDFFVPSAFDPDRQVMSIYYLMDLVTDHLPLGVMFDDGKSQQQLYFVELAGFDPTSLTFPIDRKVAEKLKEDEIKNGKF